MAIVAALMMVPMIVAAGGAIDLASFYAAKTRLIYALDSAAVAIGASTSCEDPNNVFTAYFNANYPATKNGETFDVQAPVITQNGVATTIDVAASVRINTQFLRLININTLSTQHTSRAIRRQTNLELALVLDNTDSMVDNNLMNPLKTAAGQLLDTLFRCQTVATNVQVAIVPYTGTVNIGTGNAGFTTDPGNQYPQDDGLSPPIEDTSWKGCVEARGGVGDVTDTFLSGDANQGEWRQYFWEAEDYAAAAFCTNAWFRPINPAPAIPQTQTGAAGSVSFYDAGGTNTGSFRELAGPILQSTSPSSAKGPNRGCPTPITPLTNVRSTLDSAIAAMDGWNSGTTVIPTGLAWGWRVLSQDPPFTTGVAYGTPDTTKAIVLMTDGSNQIGTNFCGFVDPRYTWNYSAYGFADDQKLGPAGTGAIQASSELNNRLTTLCDNIKAQVPPRP